MIPDGIAAGVVESIEQRRHDVGPQRLGERRVARRSAKKTVASMVMLRARMIFVGQFAERAGVGVHPAGFRPTRRNGMKRCREEPGHVQISPAAHRAGIRASHATLSRGTGNCTRNDGPSSVDIPSGALPSMVPCPNMSLVVTAKVSDIFAQRLLFDFSLAPFERSQDRCVFTKWSIA